MTGTGSILVWMRCPETLIGGNWMSNASALLESGNSRGGEKSWATDKHDTLWGAKQRPLTHTRTGSLDAATRRTSLSFFFFFVGVNAFPSPRVDCLFTIRIITSRARIPPQGLRITNFATARIRSAVFIFPAPEKALVVMLERRPTTCFIWIFWSKTIKKKKKMEQRLSKPECKSMDTCLRRLKQELVCPVLSTALLLLQWSEMYYFIKAHQYVSKI